jgi:hypothetical protein
MLIYDAARRGLEGGGNRARRFGDVSVHQTGSTGHARGRVKFEDRRLYQKEQLQLWFGHPSQGRHEHREVGLLLPFDRGRRVTMRMFKIDACRGTGQLHDALGAAANRADLLANGRTRTF